MAKSQMAAPDVASVIAIDVCRTRSAASSP